MITGLYPQSVFCAIETSGDGKVNVQSRVQMFLFKARQAAHKEYEELLARLGLRGEDVTAFLRDNPKWASPLHRAPHAAAGTAADRLAEIAPFIGKSGLGLRVAEARVGLGRMVAAARAMPGALARARKRLVTRAPVLMAQAREEWIDAKPVIVDKLRVRLRRAHREDRPVAAA